MRASVVISLLLLNFVTTACVTTMDEVDDEGYTSAVLQRSGPRLGSIPARSAKAPSGSEFGKQVQRLSGESRERAILRELRRGNMPSFLRAMQAVNVEASIQGKRVKATYWVTPDYLAVGSDSDFLYIPMTPLTAQRVADHFGFLLPTRKIVNDIYAQAEFRVQPRPMKPGPSMGTSSYYSQHNALISPELPSNHKQLIAGHKKDIVLTNKLCTQRRRVAIYGWHKASGKPIQPLSLVHGESYADYSHGVRLVAGMMLLDGQPRPVAEVLEDPIYAVLLSDEGAIKQTRIATDCYGC